MTKTITIILSFFLFMVFYYIYIGWCLSTIWNWFIVPIGVKSLTIPWAIGVSLCFQLLAGAKIIPKNKADKEIIYYMVFNPILTVLLGWVIHFNFI